MVTERCSHRPSSAPQRRPPGPGTAWMDGRALYSLLKIHFVPIFCLLSYVFGLELFPIVDSRLLSIDMLISLYRRMLPLKEKIKKENIFQEEKRGNNGQTRLQNFPFPIFSSSLQSNTKEFRIFRRTKSIIRRDLSRRFSFSSKNGFGEQCLLYKTYRRGRILVYDS